MSTVSGVQRNDGQDEISIADLYHVLCRGKVLIAVVTLLCFGAGAIYAYTATPVYESRAVVQVGQIDQAELSGEIREKQIEAPDVLTQRLSLQWGGAVSVKPLGKRRQRNVSFIEITATGATPQSASNLTSKVAGQLVSEHRTAFDSVVGLWQKERDTLKSVLTRMEGTRKLLRSRASLPDELLLRQSNLDYQIALLAGKIGELELKLQPARSFPTRLVKKPSKPQHAASPKRGRIMVLSIVLGLFLGLFAAFSHDFIRQMRRKNVEA